MFSGNIHCDIGDENERRKKNNITKTPMPASIEQWSSSYVVMFDWSLCAN